MTRNSSSNKLYRLIFSMIFVSFVLVLTPRTDVVTSQSLPEDARIFGGPERKLYNGVPTKLPLKFEMKNVTSQKWAHDLEIELTNNSDKPIYYMHVFLTIPGVKDPTTGYRVGFLLKYGRIQLIDFHEPLKVDDVPIKPGEKHTFRISEGDAKGWDYRREKEGLAEPKFLKLEFQQINFGDGTGYITTAGKPVDIRKKSSRIRDCISPPNEPPNKTAFLSQFI